LERASPAQILQNLLEKKWQLDPGDKDMIVMQHKIGYSMEKIVKGMVTSLVVTGDDTNQTAMSKTVGWPLGIAAKLVLTGKINESGVRLPVTPAYYQPIIEEMRTLGVEFIEEHYSPDS
jgi:saccharopine dehydrogenase (NADP+, L-glutamate forming)